MADHYARIGSAGREIEGCTVLIGGVGREIESGLTLVNGVQRKIEFSNGEPLTTLSAGDLIYIKENGVNVPFLLLTHNYETGLNGPGRTLFVRRYGYDMRVFDLITADFPNSAICEWLNGTYKALFANSVQNLMGQTSFGYWKPNTANTAVMTATKSIFLLSIAEVVSAAREDNPDGVYMPAIESAKILQLSESESKSYNWHTRSASRKDSDKIYAITSSGIASLPSSIVNPRASRPCFTLPETVCIDPATNELIE